MDIPSMPTPSEQKALAFLALVALLGGAVRVVRAGSVPTATTLEQQALARQANAAESSSSASKRKKGTSKGKLSRSTRDTVPRIVGGVASVPPTYARPDDPFSHTPYGKSQPLDRRGFPPPSERIDVGPPAAPRVRAPAGDPHHLIDLDKASAADIDRLPRAGPALAARIVANRDSLGPFGRIEALRRVKGIGPATLAKWAPLVSFAGVAAGPTRP